ncbi:MAG: hypothetical protein MUF28_10535 [Ignavibacterium sp.]|jgi:hypothetical protein|nr:hypothetical protein [Ignavibacterium sp.]
MKKLLFTLIFFLVLIFIGCQESSITEPTQSIAKKGNLATTETINLCCLLADPAGGNCQLKGEVNYIHQIIGSQSEGDGLYLVSLSLEMNSELCSLDGPALTRWTIEGQSEDEFYVSEEGIVIVDKAYLISNRNDIILCVQYLVTTEGVGIPSIWLQEIDNP